MNSDPRSPCPNTRNDNIQSSTKKPRVSFGGGTRVQEDDLLYQQDHRPPALEAEQQSRRDTRIVCDSHIQIVVPSSGVENLGQLFEQAQTLARGTSHLTQPRARAMSPRQDGSTIDAKQYIEVVVGSETGERTLHTSQTVVDTARRWTGSLVPPQQETQQIEEPANCTEQSLTQPMPSSHASTQRRTRPRRL